MAKQHGDKKKPRTGAIPLGKPPKGGKIAHIPCKTGAPGFETRGERKARKGAEARARKARRMAMGLPKPSIVAKTSTAIKPVESIRTGSFSDLCAGKFRKEVCFIVASGETPKWRFQHLLDGGDVIEHFARFAPNKSIRDHWKAFKDEAAYERDFIPYIQESTAKYPGGRLAHLESLIAEVGGSVRLICHEPEGEFCHRHILKTLLDGT